MRSTTGVILAGGRATRMGADKAMVEFCGQPMIEHVTAALVAAGLDPLVVGRTESPGGLPAIADIADIGGGPAVGLLTAFRHRPDSDVLLIAVDQPQIRSRTIAGILSQAGDAVVPIGSGHPQVTCALYRREAHEAVERAIAAGRMKLRRILDDVDTNYIEEPTWASWGEDGRSWRSLDTPEAVRAAEDAR